MHVAAPADPSAFLASLASLSSPEALRHAVAARKAYELELGGKALQRRLVEAQRCPQCTLKVPCLHYSSAAALPQLADGPAVQPVILTTRRVPLPRHSKTRPEAPLPKQSKCSRGWLRKYQKLTALTRFKEKQLEHTDSQIELLQQQAARDQSLAEHSTAQWKSRGAALKAKLQLHHSEIDKKIRMYTQQSLDEHVKPRQRSVDRSRLQEYHMKKRLFEEILDSQVAALQEDTLKSFPSRK